MALSLQAVPTDPEHKLPSKWNQFLAAANVVDGTSGTSFLAYQAHEAAVAATQNAPAKDEIPEDYSCSSSKLKSSFAWTSNPDELTTSKLVVGDGLVLGLQKPQHGEDVEVATASEVFDTYSIDLSDSRLVKGIVDEISKLTKVKLVYGTGLRNGIWLMPGEDDKFELHTALTYKLSTNFKDVLANIAGVLGGEYGIDLPKNAEAIDTIVDQSNVMFKVQQMTTGTNISTDPTVLDLVIAQTFRVIFSIKIKGFVFNLEYSPEGPQLDVREDPAVPGDLFSKLGNLGSNVAEGSTPPSADLAKPEVSSEFPEFHLWNVALGKDFGGGIWWVLSFAVKWQAGSQPVWIGLSYDTRVGTFTGQLLFDHMFPSDDDMLLPYWSPLEAPPVDGLPPSWDLKLLFSEAFNTNTDSLPANIPTQLTQATLEFSKLEKRLSLSATIKQSVAEDVSDTPAPFTWNEISVEVSKATGTTQAHIFSSFTLKPLPEDVDKYIPAQLAVDIRYDSGSWQFQGLVSDFQLGVLAEYADPDCSSAFVAVLGKLNVRKMSLDYTYAARKASSFLFTGTIEMGKLQLDLVYQFVSAQPSSGVAPKTAAQLASDKLGQAKPLQPSKEKVWSFEAYLGATVSDADLGSIAESIMDGAADALPQFVRDIKIGATSDRDSTPISLQVTKPKGDKSTVIFTLNVKVQGISLTFVQIAANSDRSALPIIPPKRLLRVSVAEIPLIEDIPVVQDLPQPFEKLQYVWVSERGSAWSAADIDSANTALPESEKLYYKQTNKSSEESPKISATDDNAAGQQSAPSLTPPPVRAALATGHHFIIVNGGQAVLDHCFNNAKSKPRPAQGAVNNGSAADGTDQSKDVTPQPEAPPTKARLTKQTKLLSIDAVSLQFKEGYLWINIDATVNLGPIGMSLLGFGLGLPLSDPEVKLTLDNFKVDNFLKHVKVRLNGMGVSFEKPPLLLAGVFEHEVSAFGTGTKDSYRGGIGIAFPPYTFVAVGEYSRVQLLNKEYKSVFVYAKLDGPLVTLEFATISGVRIGFGYNSSIRQPASIEEVTQFPFINDHGVGGSGNSPIKLLRSLTEGGDSAWVTPKDNSYWFAVGMTISSFDILSITACAIFAFKDSGIIIDLYANAIAQMPPGVPATDTDKMILYVEIDMHACMNFIDGYFLCEAALAPTSFLLVPQCHLYGGFALCYWFGNNPHAGDWVFSVGKYM